MQDPDSGFTEDLNKEMNQASSMPVENAYSNLREYYVSTSGHTRLFTATKYGKRYMLKCLKEDFRYIPMYQQALTKEFEIGLQLEHDNICRTIGLEQLPDLGITIVMEHIDGETLKQLIVGKMLTAELAHKIFSQLTDALEYMHNKQIIHRDLKPSNIMVTHTGQQVKLIDFGLSDSDAFHVLKIPAGTTGYIAPEQLLPGAKSEPKADIYSLGMVAFDMAEATRDKRLKRIAKICTVRDIHRRPDSIEKLRKLLSDTSHAHHLVVFLSLLVIVLAVLIGLSYTWLKKNPRESHPQEEMLEDSAYHDDSQVKEYQ